MGLRGMVQEADSGRAGIEMDGVAADDVRFFAGPVVESDRGRGQGQKPLYNLAGDADAVAGRLDGGAFPGQQGPGLIVLDEYARPLQNGQAFVDDLIQESGTEQFDFGAQGFVHRSGLSQGFENRPHGGRGVLAVAVGPDLVGPFLGDGGAADQDLEAIPQAAFLQPGQDAALVDHRRRQQGGQADQIGVGVHGRVDETVDFNVRAQVDDFKAVGREE